MKHQIEARTASGRRLAALAEEHADDFARRAADHDRDGSFPHQNIEALKQSGLISAPAPAELGGMGADSVHDLMVAINRLGRGCASTAIAVNMHFDGLWAQTRTWQDMRRHGESEAEAAAGRLRAVVQANLVVCGSVTEAGTTIVAPLTEARRDPARDGWIVNGRKIFGTLSPAADALGVSVRLIDGDAPPLLGMASIPKATPGLKVMDNWDALGMRGSGSHDVLFEDCFVDAALMQSMGPWGSWPPTLLATLGTGSACIAGAFLGIAESARELTLESLKTRRKAPSGTLLAERPAIQHRVGELEIALETARGVLSRSCARADEFYADHFPSDTSSEQIHGLMRELIAAKHVVTHEAVRAVDTCLTLSGGAGYLSGHPLSRLYRDVRAGPFMQPFSPIETFEYLGRTALGLDPDAHEGSVPVPQAD